MLPSSKLQRFNSPQAGNYLNNNQAILLSRPNEQEPFVAKSTTTKVVEGMDKASFLCFVLLLAGMSPAQAKAWTLTDIVLAGALGGAAVLVAPAVLTAAGFTSAGVAAGSVAAAAQSTFYGGYVASGSAFALAQSAGAAGIGAKGAAVIGTVVGGATLYANEE